MAFFEEPTIEQRRVKMYIYGIHGTGKTVTSLSFPDPAVIDFDGGTDWYTKAFKMRRLRTTDIDKAIQAIDELIKDPTGVKTVVIDSITKFWELLQEKHLKRLRVKKGNAAYSFQPVDYKAIKGDVKSFINKLLALDLNIVVTAQNKNVYSQDAGEFMKIVETEPDGPKEAPYMFDIVLELVMGPGDTRIAKVRKDRTNTLPKEFEFTYQKLTEYFGIKELEREPVQLRAVQALNQLSNRNVKIKFNNKEILTAGIMAATLQSLVDVTKKMDENVLRDKLNEDYSVQSLLDLREDEAKMFLADIQQTKTT